MAKCEWCGAAGLYPCWHVRCKCLYQCVQCMSVDGTAFNLFHVFFNVLLFRGEVCVHVRVPL